jgi:hypothetical protein
VYYSDFHSVIADLRDILDDIPEDHIIPYYQFVAFFTSSIGFLIFDTECDSKRNDFILRRDENADYNFTPVGIEIVGSMTRPILPVSAMNNAVARVLNVLKKDRVFRHYCDNFVSAKKGMCGVFSNTNERVNLYSCPVRPRGFEFWLAGNSSRFNTNTPGPTLKVSVSNSIPRPMRVPSYNHRAAKARNHTDFAKRNGLPTLRRGRGRGRGRGNSRRGGKKSFYEDIVVPESPRKKKNPPNQKKVNEEESSGFKRPSKRSLKRRRNLRNRSLRRRAED